jgi:hypothetical protein
MPLHWERVTGRRAVEPLFVLDLRDRSTGKRVALRLTRAEALLPLGEVVRRLLRAMPERLVAQGRLAPTQADTLFRLQDLIFPVNDCGALARRPYRGLVWRHGRDGFTLNPAYPARFERVRRADGPDVLVLPLEADRHDVRYERNWRGFHARRFARFRPTIDRLLAEAVPGGVALDGAVAERRFLEAVARRIWRADFENYSRFFPPAIPLKTGDETVEHIVQGRGGVCTEKVLALKLITDGFGLESRVVFAGPRTREPLPVARLRRMLDELGEYDFTYARRYMRYWDHVALEYRLSDGSAWLVDPSNGNIPFLCAPAGPYLDADGARRAVPVCMLAVTEPVYYHRAPERLGLDFLFAWETWIADVDLLQVFDNELGLLVGPEFYVTVAMWGSATKRAVARERWRAYARAHGLALGLEGEDATPAEATLLSDFAAGCPLQAAACRAALPGLERRYRAHVLARSGVDKSFRADLVVLDRRPLLASGGTGPPARPATTVRV